MTLQDDPLISEFHVRCEREIDAIRQDLGDGCASNHEHYVKLVGQIRGITNAIEIMEETIKLYVRDEIEDDED